MELAPGWAFLYSVSASNNHARIKSNYIFHFKASLEIPKTTSNG